jgi:hypothetical protein
MWRSAASALAPQAGPIANRLILPTISARMWSGQSIGWDRSELEGLLSPASSMHCLEVVGEVTARSRGTADAASGTDCL